MIEKKRQDLHAANHYNLLINLSISWSLIFDLCQSQNYLVDSLRGEAEGELDSLQETCGTIGEKSEWGSKIPKDQRSFQSWTLRRPLRWWRTRTLTGSSSRMRPSRRLLEKRWGETIFDLCFTSSVKFCQVMGKKPTQSDHLSQNEQMAKCFTCPSFERDPKRELKSEINQNVVWVETIPNWTDLQARWLTSAGYGGLGLQSLQHDDPKASWSLIFVVWSLTFDLWSLAGWVWSRWRQIPGSSHGSGEHAVRGRCGTREVGLWSLISL